LVEPEALPLPALSVAAVGQLADSVAAELRGAGLRVIGSGQSLDDLVQVPDATLDAVVLSANGLGERERAEIRTLRERLPGVHLVAVTAAATPRAIRQAVDDGVDGVVFESKREDALAIAIRAVCAGHIVLPATLRASVLRPALSTREKQILGMVVLGLSNAEIARKLFVSDSTVKSHLSSAFRKLGVRSRNEATELILDPNRGLGTGILTILDDDRPAPTRLGPTA
jgi:DNA-binding NarL/FixJ family response regulator